LHHVAVKAYRGGGFTNIKLGLLEYCTPNYHSTDQGLDSYHLH